MSAPGRSRRAWGWHPLVDEWARRIVADANPRPGDVVLDIGAGDGALTTHLLAAGARVLAVEPHPGRARRLRERFAGAPVTVEKDVLSVSGVSRLFTAARRRPRHPAEASCDYPPLLRAARSTARRMGS